MAHLYSLVTGPLLLRWSSAFSPGTLSLLCPAGPLSSPASWGAVLEASLLLSAHFPREQVPGKQRQGPRLLALSLRLTMA